MTTSSMSGDSMIYKTSDLEPSSSQNGMKIYVRRGPMSLEYIASLREHYENKEWRHDPESIMLSFVSSCGRWFDCFDKDTSQYYRIDGNWVVNLRQTKGKSDEIGVM